MTYTAPLADMRFALREVAGLGNLRAALEKIDADPNVRVVVLTGAGEKTFCAGYDLGSIPSGKPSPPQPGPGLCASTGPVPG